MFDALEAIVTSGQRNVRALETANLLPGAIFASEEIPVYGPIQDRLQRRRQWFETVQHTLEGADLVFVDPDNGLEPGDQRQRSSKVGKSILLSELRALARPRRCLIVYHHQTRRKGGHSGEIEHWADRLRKSGFATVDALRARPYSPRVFFLLDAPTDVQQRAEQIDANWQGWITWHPNRGTGGGGGRRDAGSGRQPALNRTDGSPSTPPARPDKPNTPPSLTPNKSGRTRSRGTTQVGYINRNGQEVIRPTGKLGTDHRQYGYVLRCRACGHEYGVNGSDIWLRRCPNHDRGAPGLAF